MVLQGKAALQAATARQAAGSGKAGTKKGDKKPAVAADAGLSVHRVRCYRWT